MSSLKNISYTLLGLLGFHFCFCFRRRLRRTPRRRRRRRSRNVKSSVSSTILEKHFKCGSDLIDLWVIKIKKPMILCVRSTSSTKRRSCERFDHSITKITRLYDYQTWQTHFLRSSRGAQRFLGSFLDCAFWMLIGSDHVANNA